MSTKMWPKLRADNSAVLVVLNVRLRVEAQHSILPLSLHDLLRISFTVTINYKMAYLCM
jgi:hypothetical protein